MIARELQDRQQVQGKPTSQDDGRNAAAELVALDCATGQYRQQQQRNSGQADAEKCDSIRTAAMVKAEEQATPSGN